MGVICCAYWLSDGAHGTRNFVFNYCEILKSLGANWPPKIYPLLGPGLPSSFKSIELASSSTEIAQLQWDSGWQNLCEGIYLWGDCVIYARIYIDHSNLNDNSKMMIFFDRFPSYYSLVGFKREEICRLHWSESIHDWKEPQIIENCFYWIIECQTFNDKNNLYPVRKKQPKRFSNKKTFLQVSAFKPC